MTTKDFDDEIISLIARASDEGLSPRCVGGTLFTATKAFIHTYFNDQEKDILKGYVLNEMQ